MKCLNCGTELEKKEKMQKIKVVLLDAKDIEFLKESNAIEGEYSQGAFDDACNAYRWAYKNIHRKFTTKYILEIHKILMKRLNKRIAGKIRDCDVWVGNRKGVDPKEIRLSLKAWCSAVNSKINVAEDLIREDHVWFEKIHPFEDGNGRTGRILMNIQRIKNKLPIIIIHEGKEQQKYYKWFR